MDELISDQMILVGPVLWNFGKGVVQDHAVDAAVGEGYIQFVFFLAITLGVSICPIRFDPALIPLSNEKSLNLRIQKAICCAGGCDNAEALLLVTLYFVNLLFDGVSSAHWPVLSAICDRGQSIPPSAHELISHRPCSKTIFCLSGLFWPTAAVKVRITAARITQRCSVVQHSTRNKT
jgi:hypothetical protein